MTLTTTPFKPADNTVTGGAAGRDSVRRAILDTALDMGDRLGWDGVQLHEVAQALGVPLSQVRAHYQHKDALAEAWFDRADAAMLAAERAPGWMALTPRERLHRALCAWLDELASHRELAVAMLRYKLHPEHVHLQVMGVMRISRTVQWLRDVAHLPEVGWRREMGEAVLTTIYLATFARWLVDDSPQGEGSRTLLDRFLQLAERGALAIRPRV